MIWPKKITTWYEGRRLCMSVPFTWLLPEARAFLVQRHAGWDTALVGGPAVQLMPEYLAELPNVEASTGEYPGVLQRVNPQATRTTTGCIRYCEFCGVGRGLIEGGQFRELDNWPNLPVIVDNNLLAATGQHFDRVMDGLERFFGPDFNQGLDIHFLGRYAASRFARLKFPVLRLALDSSGGKWAWEYAFENLIRAGVAKRCISSYALIGWNSDPAEAWERCRWIESHGVKAFPMWFHPLDAMEWNGVTEAQRGLGWDDEQRKRIMGYFYKHRTPSRGRC